MCRLSGLFLGRIPTRLRIHCVVLIGGVVRFYFENPVQRNWAAMPVYSSRSPASSHLSEISASGGIWPASLALDRHSLIGPSHQHESESALQPSSTSVLSVSLESVQPSIERRDIQFARFVDSKRRNLRPRIDYAPVLGYPSVIKPETPYPTGAKVSVNVGSI